MKTQSTLSKALRKSKEITERGLLREFERSVESRTVESVCNVVLFVIAAT